MVDRNAEAIARQLLDLSSAERARLAGLLIASLEPTEEGVEEASDTELAGRALTNSPRVVSAGWSPPECSRRSIVDCVGDPALPYRGHGRIQRDRGLPQRCAGRPRRRISSLAKRSLSTAPTKALRTLLNLPAELLMA